MTTKYGCAAYSGTAQEFQKGTATYVGWLSGKALVQRIDGKISENVNYFVELLVKPPEISAVFWNIRRNLRKC